MASSAARLASAGDGPRKSRKLRRALRHCDQRGKAPIKETTGVRDRGSWAELGREAWASAGDHSWQVQFRIWHPPGRTRSNP
eukprot:15482846-Alexandrium_andersonii.AAC.1